MPQQLECRICITDNGGVFTLGMYDPINLRHVYLGTHKQAEKDRIVRDLKRSIENAGHCVSFSEQTGRR